MKKEELHQFFSGKSSFDEEAKLKDWLDKSEENRNIFFRERKIFDAMLVSANSPAQIRKKHIQFSSFWKVITSISAVLLLLIATRLFLMMPDGTSKNENLSFNTIQVPAGQRVQLTLSDSSVVWLNSMSEFKYPTTFNKKHREVLLNGEAYFEVRKNTRSPFVVSTSKGKVRVLGTSFNVRAYNDAPEFETSLMEGRVEVSTESNPDVKTVLQPNQKSTLEGAQLIVSAISGTDEFLWREGLISFKDKSFDEILTLLERNFDVKVEKGGKTNGRSNARTYTGKFRLSDGVDYTLKVLQKSIAFQFKYDSNAGIIYIL